ncbi:MAG: tellurite resistance TerB family protein [Labilithrix sp.]|nr:tellurite resistance TerB family protein [Labilithrix sp.]
MLTDEKINLLARVARTPHGDYAEGSTDRSILTLAASSYGSRPTDESTVPTGFDPLAAALFESIVEGAYIVATADGVFDEEERKVFERVVTASCGGAVPQRHIADLVADLADQLAEDGLDRRLSRLGESIVRREHGREVVRIAALIAQVSDDVSDVERSVLEKLAVACNLEPAEVDVALADVKKAIEG